MKKLHFVLIIISLVILVAVTGLSLFARSIVPADWYWAIYEEMIIYSKFDTVDSEIILLDKDWNNLVKPFIDIDSFDCVESIDIYLVHPIKRNCTIGISWKGKNSNYGIDEYLRDNSDYKININGWRPKSFLLLLLATSPVYDKPYDKNYDEQEVCGIVIDVNLSDGVQKTFIMVYDDQNVFYEKNTEKGNRIYRKMPKILLKKFILTYGETMKEFRQNTK